MGGTREIEPFLVAKGFDIGKRCDGNSEFVEGMDHALYDLGGVYLLMAPVSAITDKKDLPKIEWVENLNGMGDVSSRAKKGSGKFVIKFSENSSRNVFNAENCLKLSDIIRSHSKFYCSTKERRVVSYDIKERKVFEKKHDFISLKSVFNNIYNTCAQRCKNKDLAFNVVFYKELTTYLNSIFPGIKVKCGWYVIGKGSESGANYTESMAKAGYGCVFFLSFVYASRVCLTNANYTIEEGVIETKSTHLFSAFLNANCFKLAPAEIMKVLLYGLGDYLVKILDHYGIDYKPDPMNYSMTGNLSIMFSEFLCYKMYGSDMDLLFCNIGELVVKGTYFEVQCGFGLKVSYYNEHEDKETWNWEDVKKVIGKTNRNKSDRVVQYPSSILTDNFKIDMARRELYRTAKLSHTESENIKPEDYHNNCLFE